ncbi:MAG: SRPBCC domain-containing protein [Proteobacteria bacterium]|nr:SRPBCC domain-containing protein [Pseudomonadota bacterium]
MAEFKVTHIYDAAPERVFDAWLDAAIARLFLFATPTGEMIRAELDARVGGKFTFVGRRPDMGDVLHTGEYLEIDRPRRLAFTFGVPQFNPDMTKVELDFAPTASGGCELTLTQRDVPAEWADRSRDGWSKIVASLEGALAGKKAQAWG